MLRIGFTRQYNKIKGHLFGLSKIILGLPPYKISNYFNVLK